MCTYVFFPVFLSGCLELCVRLSFSCYFSSIRIDHHDYGFFVKRIEWRFNTETIKHTAHNQLSYINQLYRYMYISSYYYYVSYCLLRYIIIFIIIATIDTLW